MNLHELENFIEIRQLSGVNAMVRGSMIDQANIVVTIHQLIFDYKVAGGHQEVFFLINRAIDLIELQPSSANAYDVLNIILKCKDMHVITLFRVESHNAIAFKNTLVNLSRVSNVTLMFPFFYTPTDYNVIESGYDAFTPEVESGRFLNQGFRLSNANLNFDLCPSYPRAILVPDRVFDDQLRKIALFRRKGRFPVPVFIHPQSRAVLVRGSEPLSGSQGRCQADVDLLKLYAEKPGRGQNYGYIFDLRSKTLLSQKQNASSGGNGSDAAGWSENMAHYVNWKLEYANLQAANVMKQCHEKLAELLAEGNVDKYLQKIIQCGWFQQIFLLMKTSKDVAIRLSNGHSIFVHCSDGFDLSLQVTSIAQIILSADTRRIRGFLALIDRDWIQAGHPFKTRCQNGPYTRPPNSNSFAAPIFLQFLDVVYQLMQQHPFAFEFTESLLRLLAQHVYFSEFGTFLCDSERDQVFCNDGVEGAIDVKKHTVSLWSYLLLPHIVETFQNQFYLPNETSEFLRINGSPAAIRLWPYYNRFNCRAAKMFDTMSECEVKSTPVDDIIADVEEATNSIKRETKRLFKQVAVYQSDWQQMQRLSDSGVTAD